ncbi:hypothetical protein [Viridibacillus sp. FSL R5-0888]|uniref:hypothetical protein n=1 Tax=Viridibacillus sp. FSL R5-0888 TaxID=2921663 RepID=UPI0030FB2054
MKKYILLSSLLAVSLLTACGETEKTTETNKAPETTQQTESKSEKPKVETTTKKSNDVDFKSIIKENIGEKDKLVAFSNKGSEIKATIELDKNNLLTPNDMAESRYSSISGGLLEVEDWQTLTVNFVDVGEVSFNRDEAETNDILGSFFPTAKIAKKLGNIE